MNQKLSQTTIFLQKNNIIFRYIFFFMRFVCVIFFVFGFLLKLNASGLPNEDATNANTLFVKSDNILKKYLTTSQQVPLINGGFLRLQMAKNNLKVKYNKVEDCSEKGKIIKRYHFLVSADTKDQNHDNYIHVLAKIMMNNIEITQKFVVIYYEKKDNKLEQFFTNDPQKFFNPNSSSFNKKKPIAIQFSKSQKAITLSPVLKTKSNQEIIIEISSDENNLLEKTAENKVNIAELDEISLVIDFDLTNKNNEILTPTTLLSKSFNFPISRFNQKRFNQKKFSLHAAPFDKLYQSNSSLNLNELLKKFQEIEKNINIELPKDNSYDLQSDYLISYKTLEQNFVIIQLNNLKSKSSRQEQDELLSGYINTLFDQNLFSKIFLFCEKTIYDNDIENTYSFIHHRITFPIARAKLPQPKTLVDYGDDYLNKKHLDWESSYIDLDNYVADDLVDAIKIQENIKPILLDIKIYQKKIQNQEQIIN